MSHKNYKLKVETINEKIKSFTNIFVFVVLSLKMGRQTYVEDKSMLETLGATYFLDFQTLTGNGIEKQ